MKKIVGALAVFVITYALFSAAGYLFPVDQEWYNSLKKPDWTPSGTAIGIIWAILFALISLSAAIVYAAFSFKGAKSFLFTLLINYVLNQAFSYFQFTQKNLLAASLDCLLVAITAIVLLIIAKKYSRAASYLLLPYFLWSAFATFLSFTINSMNL
ncbi:TspO/MBR family protein [Bacillus subtilis]|uniref:TspO/MBR family protein n=1 Tax=Bacillus subtilis TaxID=1423 RepID=UPI000B3EDEE5|nr:TspO/MBR family protein [Bacillus subtilis]ARV99954.1 putative membrane protein YtaB [Bacillus subtilis subsp. subtilis]ARW04025.1 putative membrane protein YtaB [Bacillus subtilis subsp. subtilis]ASB58434.1 putative membrane protein YtaB [Bacillus subtilis subsp. subtilis]MCA0105995.1 TspO/MBR family protein [Bacillus subtilis]QAW55209.1 tryptophan-rich sensory protein [Bacillus subtilis]